MPDNWRETLIEKVKVGDTDALEVLRRALPSEMPGRTRQWTRDTKLRYLAGVLRQHFPGEASAALAGLLHLAGNAREAGRRLLAPFDELGDDLASFIATIDALLPLLRADPRTGSRWPCERTIRSVIA